VEARPLVSGQKAGVRFLPGEILPDCVRLPHHVVAVLERGHAHIGIERGVLRCLVRTLGQIEEANLVVEAEMVGDCQHLEGPRAWRKDVQLDGHDVLLVMWNSDSLRCGIQCYPARPAACVDRPDASASRLKCSSMPGQPPSTSLRMEAPASAPSRSNLRC